MFRLNPSTSGEIFSESDVNSPAALKKTSYADLSLMPADDNSGNSVLICKVVVQMEFTDGKSQQSATQGQALVWTDAEKTAFAQSYAAVIKNVWDFQWEIKGVSGYFHHSAAVRFDVVVKTGATIFKHYHINVTKSDAFITSYVKGDRPFIGSDVELDTGDVTGVSKGASMPQRAAAHEFGHMISYDDEYNTGRNRNTNFLTDTDSVMNAGEILRKRHYVLLADWITKKYKGFTGTSFDDSDPILWKVDGDTDLSNAQI